jgi:hypothetical protein
MVSKQQEMMGSIDQKGAAALRDPEEDMSGLEDQQWG